ncbi:DUF3054 domain-containing protein [Occultella glacieicola]|uniref:DUF3054 domain-containing protein n=1 Tax=Occultella glacieicola TaxID=2518684 RepID=A0ABY2E8P5_9MICO|nr:DUF3054 domain-containing protein [Occultella glacieicola]TDE97362.1 DUF3054 domain-containing protein [Occultella glacieicola]
MPGTRTTASSRTIVVAAVVDVVAVGAFALAGRGTHHEDGVLAGLAGTAWPFGVALAIGWLLARAWRAPLRLWPTGAAVWAMTVAGGLGLRGLTGGGLSGAFPIVTAVVLGVFLLGWRAVATLLTRRSGPTGPTGPTEEVAA